MLGNCGTYYIRNRESKKLLQHLNGKILTAIHDLSDEINGEQIWQLTELMQEDVTNHYQYNLKNIKTGQYLSTIHFAHLSAPIITTQFDLENHSFPWSMQQITADFYLIQDRFHNTLLDHYQNASVIPSDPIDPKNLLKRGTALKSAQWRFIQANVAIPAHSGTFSQSDAQVT